MNTAFLDALNLAWKIHAVEGGFANRSILETYESERRAVAESLLEFDNRYAKLFSERTPTPCQVRKVSLPVEVKTGESSSENAFIEAFKEACEFTSGYGVSYQANILNWSPDHPASSSLIQPEGTKLVAGKLFMNADVTRVTDANLVHLEQEVPLNGSFRLFIFAGEPAKNRNALRDLSYNLNSRRSFYAAYARSDLSKVSPHEKHNPHSHFFTICTIFAAKRYQIEISRDVPPVLARYRDHIYADDGFDRRVPCANFPAHAKMGLDDGKGCVVVVRPDGYVAMVTALVEGSGTAEALDEYFAAFCTKKLGGTMPQL